MKIKSIALISFIVLFSAIVGCNGKGTASADKKTNDSIDSVKQEQENKMKPVDKAAYETKLKAIANGDTTGLWPVQNQPTPVAGAILPFQRIVAYYGNLYSKKMGALGEYEPKEMWARLKKEVAAWNAADPSTPAIPAVHYIAVVAAGDPVDGKYRRRMPESQIDSALTIAKMENAIVFLDIQVSLSNIKTELPLLEKYLMMPHVHLGIDPEFSMKDGTLPGKKIGTYDAADINYASSYLADLVKKHNLPAKVLVVHRFTRKMITNYKNIQLHPEVQLVINMDGWGEPTLKYDSYQAYVYKEPVKFTGFKLFYKNDLKKAPHRMLTPAELMKLKPQPIYIQYQ